MARLDPTLPLEERGRRCTAVHENIFMDRIDRHAGRRRSRCSPPFYAAIGLYSVLAYTVFASGPRDDRAPDGARRRWCRESAAA